MFVANTPPPAHCVAAVVTRSRACFSRDLSLDDLVSSRLGSAGGGKGARGLKITIAGARGRGRGRGGAGPVRGTSSAREARLVDRSAGVLSRRGAAGGQVKRVRCRDASVGVAAVLRPPYRVLSVGLLTLRVLGGCPLFLFAWTRVVEMVASVLWRLLSL